jgi:hypothetical protein
LSDRLPGRTKRTIPKHPTSSNFRSGGRGAGSCALGSGACGCG